MTCCHQQVEAECPRCREYNLEHGKKARRNLLEDLTLALEENPELAKNFLGILSTMVLRDKALATAVNLWLKLG
jgi:hypothetical protein